MWLKAGLSDLNVIQSFMKKKDFFLKGRMQYSFTKDILCQMNLMILFDKIIDFLDKSSAVDLISLDFYKVFGIVKRLVKLEKMGISEIVQEMSGELGRVYNVFWKVWGTVAAPGVPLGLVGEVDCVYNSNVPGTKGDALTFVAEMKLGWISTIVEVQKTVLKKGDSLAGCSRRDGSVKRDVIVQRARLGTERIMPCIISVKWGLSSRNNRGELSEVSCSGVPGGTLEKEFADLWCTRRPVWTSLSQGLMRSYLEH